MDQGWMLERSRRWKKRQKHGLLNRERDFEYEAFVREEPLVLEALSVATDLAHWLQVWIDNHPGQTWCYSEAALVAWRALAEPGDRREGDTDE